MYDIKLSNPKDLAMVFESYFLRDNLNPHDDKIWITNFMKRMIVSMKLEMLIFDSNN